MTSMQIKVEHPIEGGVRLGVEPCACGGCHPTATAYEGDPQYERHDPALAEGPCCCGRFFVLADSPERALRRAEALRARLDASDDAGSGLDYVFDTQRLRLPWGEEVIAVVADLAKASEPAGGGRG